MKIFILFLCFTQFLFSSSSGKIGATNKNGNGCTCHGNLNNSVSVIISGPDTIKVGEIKNYSVTISGGSLAAAGFNVASSNGTLTAIDGQKIGSELTHSSPKTPSAGAVVFQFKFSSDAIGSSTIYAVGNSVNLNGGESGDSWNHAINKTVTVLQGTNFKEDLISPRDLTLYQNFPNPFNPTTTINYNLLKDGFVNLKIINSSGEEIKTLVNENQISGNHKIQFNAKALPSGNYFYILKTNNKSLIKKMILIK